MKDIDYQDESGRWWRVRVPDDCPVELYASGIPVGPPSLDSLEDMPEATKVRLHNELFHRGILTRRDALRFGKEIFAALQAAYRTDMQRIQTVFMEQGG